ncbi:putative receptor protein kinase ZmPK1 [Trifolium repens]|nr:putative receptor protein kinase ZmPK1 [Trifolium repens]
MAFTISHIFLLLILLFSFQNCSCHLTSLRKGPSLSVEKREEDVIVSSNGIFSAGFYQIVENAFSFAIWFTELEDHSHNPANIVWMANREQPVNGKKSKLFLLNTGNILLLDAGQHNIWSSNTASNAPLELYLKEDGNLVLRELQGTTILWQSYDFPTNTLLPNQPLARHTNLVSSRSQSNHSSGFYKLFFDDNNILRLDYDGLDVSSTYWPPSWILPWEAGRSNYNSTRVALLDSLGKFISSDNYIFSTNDHGMVIQRRLTIDSDGNIRVYSRKNLSENWYVSWQVITDTCIIHGICGPNSTCSYDPKNGKKCSCLPGYKMKNHSDWSYGCEPMFDFTCNKSESTFLKLQGYELFGYDTTIVEWETFTEFSRNNLHENPKRRYSYSELKLATKNFSNEIGRGGGGIVYRGTLPDQRHAAIKRLNEAQQGEGEFLAEVSIIGRLNHMNLIEMWGYCVEGKHRLLVYEYMENGSLAETLSSKTIILDWSKSYGVVLLEMVTGKSPTMMNIEGDDGEVAYNGRLITWVREKKRSNSTCWVEEIMDPSMVKNCDLSKMEVLARVALDCVEEDRDIRPTMSQVAEMLQSHDKDVV